MLNRIVTAFLNLLATLRVVFREEILGKPKPAPRPKVRSWIMAFEVSGKAGEVRYAMTHPMCIFRGEQLIAIDDSSVPGNGTFVERVEVQMKPQMTPVPYGDPISTHAFMKGIGTRLQMQTCQPAETIMYQIRFVEDCTWYGALFGPAVLS